MQWLAAAGSRRHLSFSPLSFAPALSVSWAAFLRSPRLCHGLKSSSGLGLKGRCPRQPTRDSASTFGGIRPRGHHMPAFFVGTITSARTNSVSHVYWHSSCDRKPLLLVWSAWSLCLRTRLIWNPTDPEAKPTYFSTLQTPSIIVSLFEG